MNVDVAQSSEFFITWAGWAIMAGTVIALLALLFFWWKGRLIRQPGPDGSGGIVHVFRASRLSSGNRLFPTQVIVTRASVVHFTPQWIGKREHSIHLAHIASVTIDTNLMFSDVVIETTGGTKSVTCHGHHKGDAVRMKELVEQYQTEYYKKQ